MIFLHNTDFPFNEDIPSINKIDIDKIPRELLTDNIKELMFPDLISDSVAYHHGCSKQDWKPNLADLIIFVLEHNIYTIIIFFTYKNYRIINLEGINWKDMYEIPREWDPVNKYAVGYSVSIMQSLEYTLDFLPDNLPYQMFITDKQSFNISKNVDTTRCNEIIKSKGLKIYAHSPYVFNLANPGLGEKIRKYLIFATAVGVKGVVFHVGSQTNKTLEESLLHMKENILYAMNSNLCPIILEISAGDGTKVLTNYKHFVNFFHEIYLERPNFSICIDSCHAYSCGYDPYQYFKYCLENGCKIGLIHYNDSKFGFDSRKDRHAPIGMGKINWLSLERVASLAYQLDIDCIIEY